MVPQPCPSHRPLPPRSLLLPAELWAAGAWQRAGSFPRGSLRRHGERKGTERGQRGHPGPARPISGAEPGGRKRSGPARSWEQSQRLGGPRGSPAPAAPGSCRGCAAPLCLSHLPPAVGSLWLVGDREKSPWLQREPSIHGAGGRLHPCCPRCGVWGDSPLLKHCLRHPGHLLLVPGASAQPYSPGRMVCGRTGSTHGCKR